MGLILKFYVALMRAVIKSWKNTCKSHQSTLIYYNKQQLILTRTLTFTVHVSSVAFRTKKEFPHKVFAYWKIKNSKLPKKSYDYGIIN